MHFILAASLFASFQQPSSPKLVWTEIASMELTCTAVAPEQERRALGLPLRRDARDSAATRRFFSSAMSGDSAELRHLEVLGYFGWWANRTDDQGRRAEVYAGIADRADRFVGDDARAGWMHYLSLCARSHLVVSMLARGQLELAQQMAEKLASGYDTRLDAFSGYEWPLMLALRETKLDSAAHATTRILLATLLRIGATAERLGQRERASRIFAAMASAHLALGARPVARALAIHSVTAAGSPAPVHAMWRSFGVLYDAELGGPPSTTLQSTAARLAASASPDMQVDARDAVTAQHRIARWLEQRGQPALARKFDSTAFARLSQSLARGDPPSMAYLRAYRLERTKFGRDDLREYVKLDPRFARQTRETARSTVMSLESQFTRSIAGDTRVRELLRYKIDNALSLRADLLPALPTERLSLTDEAFRLTQLRSFGLSSLAILEAEVRRADTSLLGVTERTRLNLERILGQSTNERAFLRTLLQKIAIAGESEAQRDGSLWPIITSLDIMHAEKVSKFDEVLAVARSIAPSIADALVPKSKPIAEFQRRLGATEALLVTQVDPNALYVWMITKTDARFVRREIPERDVTELVRRLRAGLAPNAAGGSLQLPPFDAAAAYALYNLLFTPFADMMGRVTELSWYGDGPLASVPPAVLVSTATSLTRVTTTSDFQTLRFLVDRFVLRSIPELAMFLPQRERTQPTNLSGAFLGIGSPMMTLEEIERGPQSRSAQLAGKLDYTQLENLPKLEEAVGELRAIASVLGTDRSTLWLGPDADEHKFVRNALERFGIVAFATHGFLSEEVTSIGEPSLMLRLRPEATDRFDGLLYATEIFNLTLRAELVILSACNTASGDGRPQSEAFSGLGRAFFAAGARNILMSHWPVISTAASQITTGMITRTANGRMSLAQSLRESMLAARRDVSGGDMVAHPAYWGAFVLAGSSN